MDNLKILLVCPYDLSYHGGVQNHVLQFATKAAELGHDTSILAPFSHKDFPNEYPGLKIIYAGRPVPVPIGRGTVSRIAIDPQMLWALAQINQENYDVIHIHAPETPLLGLLSLAFADKKSSIVTTSHANYGSGRYPTTLNALTKTFQLHRLASKIDVRIAVSEAARESISRYMPGDYIVIPNGIDTQRFSPEVLPIGKLEGKVNILFVGRLGNNEIRKGLSYLVSAFDILRLKYRYKVALTIVGPGKPDRETVEVLNRISNDGIRFIGEVSGNALPGYYASADICCFPATGNESFGLVLAEAMASGKPVVASNITGYRNVVLGRNGENHEINRTRIHTADAGLLVKPRDAEALAEGLEILVRYPALRQSMGEAGRQIVLKNYSWARVAHRILEVHKSVRESRKAAISI